MLSTTLMSPVMALGQDAGTEQAATRQFAIPAQSLGSALTQFGRQSGLQVSLNAAIADGLATNGVNGDLAPEAALRQLLSGTGLTYSFGGGNTVIIGTAGAPELSGQYDGSIVLDTVDVNAWVDGAGGGLTTESVYVTPGSVAHVSGETLERFRGDSPADMFRGVPGVISSNATSGAGSIDVNIRGMQGLGRVAMKVDGAENQVTIYQGYQGISNRSFVDPDLIAGIDIKKGPDVSSSGIAGTVAMRTVDASDIVKDGNTFGLKVKVGGGGNTTAPVAGAKGGYQLSNYLEDYPVVSSTEDGMDRPNLLKPTQGSISLIGAIQIEDIDLLLGYAYRARGNYYAGSNGPGAEPEYIGEQPFCYPSGECPYVYKDYVINGGLTNYRAGEEVLNTALMTSTFLAKGT